MTDPSVRDEVTPSMRARLLRNRQGRLTSEQWREIVSEPLVPLLLLMVPGIIVLRSTLLAFFIGGLWLVGLLALAGIGLMLAVRARRYARLPLRFATLRAGDERRPFWMFWKPVVLFTDDDRPVRFARSLAPYMALRPGRRYLVYYLEDRGVNVLCSIAPADHADAAGWNPSATFQARIAQRRHSS